MSELSRVYQGRVHAVRLQDSSDAKNWIDIPDQDVASQSSDCPLWNFHVIYQAGSAYYLVALSGMIDPSQEGLLSTFRKQVEQAWDDSSHLKNSHSLTLRDQLQSYLGLDETSTYQDALDVIFEGNNTDRDTLHLAVTGLADQLISGKGGGNIQQIGRGELPKFCVSDCTANFAGDPLIKKRAYHQKLLPWVLFHYPGLSPEDTVLDQFDVYSIATPNKKIPEKTGDEAIRLLTDAATELKKEFPEESKAFEDLATKIEALEPSAIALPNYVGSSAKGAVKLRLYALFLFKYVEKSEFTLSLLKQTHKEPSNDKKPEAIEFDESAVDPLEQSRGERGYVFPAFSALRNWNPEHKGAPTWSEFEIATFKEAITTLNQFAQKTEERIQQRTIIENLVQWILEGDSKALASAVNLTPPKDDLFDKDYDKEPFTFHGDPRIEPVDRLISELGKSQTENLPPLDRINGDGSSDTVVSYGIYKGTLRGYKKLREAWNSLYQKNHGLPSVDALEEVVRELQKSDRYGIGSAPLFMKLCQPENWPIWLEIEESRREVNSWAWDPLFAWAIYSDMLGKTVRLSEPINFTPPEPRTSQRFATLSNFDGKSAAKFGTESKDGHDEKRLFVEVSIAHRNGSGVLSEKRARVFFASRRMDRDGICMAQAVAKRHWAQPLVKALALPEPENPVLKKDPAVTLMPKISQIKGNETVRMLLNFPITVDTDWLTRQLALKRWPDTQKESPILIDRAKWFGWTNGNNHLHWGTKTDKTGTFSLIKRKTAPTAPFHDDPDLIANGFSLISTDLGVRDAGAFAILETQVEGRSFLKNKKPTWTVGTDPNGKTWRTALTGQGLIRLPGEDAKVCRPKTRLDRDSSAKSFRTELHGESGRNASDTEWMEARSIARRLGIRDEESLDQWLGKEATTYSFPEQNDKLIRIISRAQSRLATWQRWSWKLNDSDNTEAGSDEIINSFSRQADAALDEAEQRWLDLANAQEHKKLCSEVTSGYNKLKQTIREELENIANRILPLRQASWVIEDRGDEGAHIELTRHGSAPEKTPKVRGQRGLSIQRISQLEDFRRRILSFNRANGHKAKERPKFGKRGLAPEPCRDLLVRLDKIKEQRVNQTAHQILANALGLRLKVPSGDKQHRSKQDIHGEYEPIPNRKPVDLIVIEDLNRYKSEQGKSRRENTQLMKWCHRAIRDKLAEICEPFGIPVLEVQPAYSSKFHSKSGIVGFRAEETAALPKDHFFRRQVEARTQKNRESNQSLSENDRNLALVFDTLDTLQKRLTESGKTLPKHRRTLVVPRDGGPLFLTAKQGDTGPTQSDLNAAINLGLAAIAHHDNLAIHRKIRAIKKGDLFQVVTDNKREKAVFNKNTVVSPQSSRGFDEKFSKQQRVLFFVDCGNIAKYDRVTIEGVSHPVTSSRALFSQVKEAQWARCWEINLRRIKKHNWLTETEIRQLENQLPDYFDDLP